MKEKPTKMIKLTPSVHQWLRIESVKRGITVSDFLEIIRKRATKRTS